MMPIEEIRLLCLFLSAPGLVMALLFALAQIAEWLFFRS